MGAQHVTELVTPPAWRRDPKVRRLASTTLLAGSSTRALMHLAATGDEVRVPAGTTFLLDSVAPAFAYLVLHGALTPAPGLIPPPRLPTQVAETAAASPRIVVAAQDLAVLVLPTRLVHGVLQQLPELDAHLLRAKLIRSALRSLV